MPIDDIRIGTDIVSVIRLKKSLKRFGLPFIERLLTEHELAYCANGKPENERTPSQQDAFLKRVAGRIAIKEATSKALGVGVTGLGYSKGVPWQSIEMVSTPQAPPELLLRGKALTYAQTLNIKQWRISISHDGDHAVATVLGLI